MGKMGWAPAEEAAEKAGGGLFVKLATTGDKVVLAFVGDPFTYEVFYNEKTSSYEDFSKEHEKAGKKPSYKYKFNAFVPAEKAIKIYECGVQVFKDVLVVKKKYGLENKLYEITRQGVKGDTKTTYTLLPERDMTADERALMMTLPLNDLTAKDDDEKGSTAPNAGSFSTYGGAPAGDAVVDVKTAEVLIQRLKVLPAAAVDKFRTRLAVGKIKELKAKDAALAERFVAFLEGKGPDPDAPAPAAKPAGDQDPFAD